MKPQKFISELREDEIIAAIQAAEKKTSGQLRIFISHKSVEDPVAAAQKEFARLGMEKTRERNAVLIFLAPDARKFAVIGDEGVHTRCGDVFWRELAQTMSGHFRKSEFTEGILQGIKRAGDLLAEHFPRLADGRNELPDQIEHD